jgi:hypothetical protein
VVFIHALRSALCPSPGLLELLRATGRGDLDFTSRRRRIPQPAQLSGLLRRWILG